MPSVPELREKLWNALKSDLTVMLGVEASKSTVLRPMTAQFKPSGHKIWFFTSKDAMISKELKKSSNSIFTFVSRKHDVFATVHGTLEIDTDKATLDMLWNRYVAAWFEKGKEDPKLLLLRMEPKDAEIWLDDSSFFAGIRMMIGLDPKEEYKDNSAKVKL